MLFLQILNGEPVILIRPCFNRGEVWFCELPERLDRIFMRVFGETISLEESLENAKPMIIYFSDSYYSISTQNWPALSEVYPDYEDKLMLVAIGIDPTDDNETMQELAEEKGFTFPVTHGLPEIMLDYNVVSQATTVGVGYT